MLSVYLDNEQRRLTNKETKNPKCIKERLSSSRAWSVTIWMAPGAIGRQVQRPSLPEHKQPLIKQCQADLKALLEQELYPLM